MKLFEKMLRLVLVFACVAGTFASTSPLNERIVGGQDALPNQFPYQVSLRLRQTGQHHCGGTIINTRFIITAAHCVYQHAVNDFVVVIGSNSITSGGIVHNLENFVYFGEYDPKSMNNDIAILKTSKDMEFSIAAQAISLQQSEVPVGSILFLSGWGLTNLNENTSSDILQYLPLRSIKLTQCSDPLPPGNIFESQICTLGENGKGPCAGDSGGPLTFEGKLAGVMSWGRLCAFGYPDVFTKVKSYLSWIQITTQTM